MTLCYNVYHYAQLENSLKLITMSTDNNFQDRIKLRMKTLGMTQEELANQIGVTRSAINHYLAGRRVPPLLQFVKMAEVLKTEPGWLQFGTNKKNNIEHDEIIESHATKDMPTLYKIPILAWNQLGEMKSIHKLNPKKVTAWVPHLFTDKLNCFALQIKGDSMTAPSGHMTSFKDGDIVQFTTDRKAEHGNYVIAILSNAKEATFKQYVEDGGMKFLKPLNPQYPIIPIDKDTQICGVLTAHFSQLEDRLFL